ncbi:MAG: hypothetical protein ACK5WP_03580 [Neisseriaceae bacterium]
MFYKNKISMQNNIFKLINFLVIFGLIISHKSFADDIKQKTFNNKESEEVSHTYSSEHYTQNDFSVEEEEIEAAKLKNLYISPFNYTQNPVAYSMGTTTQAGPNGTYQVGLSVIGSGNIPLNGVNSTFNVDAFQVWGQTGRWNGFALGGTVQGVQTIRQVGQPNTFEPYSVLAPTQAYINYQQPDLFQITAGNILLNTPWVNSLDNVPGATFANTNNTFLGFTANVQLLPSLILMGFHAYSYLQYPYSFPNAQNLYNTYGGPLANMGSNATNMGVTGVGTRWNPGNGYRARLWFYQFVDYANMWYFENSYNLALSKDYSMDFGFQAFNQSSGDNSITTYTPLPGANTPAGIISSNGIGLKWVINIPHDTISVSYNNIFGPDNSFLNGGMLTPYTYGLETDPLYTTPALTSLAELGSGSAYTIRNSWRAIENKLTFNVSYSQFFTNQAYGGQPNAPINEWDAAMIYNWDSHFNVWTRLVYLDAPSAPMWQPRIIFNYSF